MASLSLVNAIWWRTKPMFNCNLLHLLMAAVGSCGRYFSKLRNPVIDNRKLVVSKWKRKQRDCPKMTVYYWVIDNQHDTNSPDNRGRK